MSERIRGGYDDALYKSTFTLLYFTLQDIGCHVRLTVQATALDLVLRWSWFDSHIGCYTLLHF